jgi:hypothetical protein
MVGQLERSAARKRLTELCSEAIIDIISVHTTPKTSKKKVLKQYLSAVKITLGNAVEAMTGKQIPLHLTENGCILSFFNGEVENIGNARSSKSIIEVKDFIKQKSDFLSEEDLGGVSELFSGHMAIWKDGEVILAHNPARRGAGKIYTPFDVTNYMCNLVADNLISDCKKPAELLQKRVLDPAIGSGAFCSQLIRVLWKLSSEKWELNDDVEFKVKICNNVIYASDIDDEALQLAKVVLWISAGTPDLGLELNLSKCDSLEGGPCENKADWSAHSGLKIGSGYDAVLGNPPYVAKAPEEIYKFKTKKTRNLYCAFTELGLNLIHSKGLVCFIVPQSIMGGKQIKPLRDIILGLNASVHLQVFDSVPDFLFDQGKVESNSNTNINQRTTIIIVNKSKGKSLSTSPLMRWRRTSERDILFDNLSSVNIEFDDIYESRIPMVSDNKERTLLRKIRKVKTKISDVASSDDSKSLYITKAVRYFITALPESLGRDNTMKIDVFEHEFTRVHVLLNSNFFYWWWRVFGNGFQIETKDVETFPLIPLDKGFCDRMSKELKDAEEECEVFKRNAGKDVPNVNYNFIQDKIKEIDNKIFSYLRIANLPRVFESKSNSLSGRMDELIGYDSIVAGIELNIENKSTKLGVKQILLSSIAAWTKDKLPKFVIVWETNKKMARIAGRNGRDIEGILEKYHIYYVDEEINVPWEDNPLTHAELTGMKWDSSIDQILKAEVNRLNKKYPDKVIKLQKSFKNGDSIRLQYEISNHNNLPQVPGNIKETVAYKSIKETCDDMIGSILKVKKYNLPELRGERVWITEEILQMEHHTKQELEKSGCSKAKASKRAKDVGELYLIRDEEKTPEGENLSATKYAKSFSAKEDYWVGNAIDVVMEYMNKHLKQTSAKATGVDLKLNAIMSNFGKQSKKETVRETKKLKHAILLEIQRILGIEPKDSDTSTGSTVTRSALSLIAEEIYRNNGLENPDIKSKKKCIESSLAALGEEFETDDVSNGGTVTAYSLFKILRKLKE